MRRRIITLFITVASFLGFIGLGAFFSQPSWKRAIQIAHWTECLDDSAVAHDKVAQAAIEESDKASTKQEKANIFFYALLTRDPGGAHEGEEISEAVSQTNCGHELAALIRVIPEFDWNKLSDLRKQNLHGFVSEDEQIIHQTPTSRL